MDGPQSSDGQMGPCRKENLSKQICFLLCETCFWCASAISFRSKNEYNYEWVSNCPICNSNKIESMPISSEELYKSDYDMKREIDLRS